jgi:uncharacterized protein
MAQASKWASNVAAWFEIPAADFGRAVEFYEGIFETKLERETMGEARLAIFPFAKPNMSGSITAAPGYQPSPDGNVVYFDAQPDLTATLARVERRGGVVVVPKTALGPGMGYFAQFLDSEGNKVGLFSLQ